MLELKVEQFSENYYEDEIYTTEVNGEILTFTDKQVFDSNYSKDGFKKNFLN